jgi:hypothetical protein
MPFRVDFILGFVSINMVSLRDTDFIMTFTRSMGINNQELNNMPDTEKRLFLTSQKFTISI